MLDIGDLLTTRAGSLVAVEGVGDSGEVTTVYNWRIADYHTYFVSATDDGLTVWAHNADELYGFGNRGGPRAPRRGKDYEVDAKGIVHPTDPPTGASLFGDVSNAPLSGHYHKIAKDVKLPPGTGIIADGRDVGGTHAPTHHTFYVTQSMPEQQFLASFLGLPWGYGGKK